MRVPSTNSRCRRCLAALLKRQVRIASSSRRGQADSWHEELEPGLEERIIADHKPTMRRLGYDAVIGVVGSPISA